MHVKAAAERQQSPLPNTGAAYCGRCELADATRRTKNVKVWSVSSSSCGSCGSGPLLYDVSHIPEMCTCCRGEVDWMAGCALQRQATKQDVSTLNIFWEVVVWEDVNVNHYKRHHFLHNQTTNVQRQESRKSSTKHESQTESRAAALRLSMSRLLLLPLLM